MNLKTLHDLFIHELQDLHSAESQLTEALPRMLKAATTPELQEALESHLAETLLQLEKVEAMLEELQAGPGKTRCVAMAGIIKEGSDLLTLDGEASVKEAALIATSQRIEHYERAAYESAISMAQVLALDDVASRLEQILREEEAASQTLSLLAESVNFAALEASDA